MKDIIDKNFDEIVKVTNKYLKKYNYEYNGETLSIEIEQDKESEEFKLVTYPKRIFWSSFIFSFNRQGDIFLINKHEDTKTKLVSYNFMFREVPELIVREIFKDLLKERDYLREEFMAECV